MRKVLFIFGELNDMDIDWMIAAGRKQRVERGEILIEEGKPVDGLYIVLDGKFVVTVAGLREEVAQLGAGEIAGEMSFVEARPPSATVKALNPSLVLAIPRKDLNSKIKQDTAFAARFFKAISIFLSYRLRKTMARAAAGGKDSGEEDAADELDGNVLDNVYLAGARFDRMIKKLIS